MRITATIPGEVTADKLNIMLEAATRLAQYDIAEGNVPTVEEMIADGAVWRPEPPGQESFDPPSTILARGWGDCDDWAPTLSAEMRENGFDPGAKAIAVQSGPRTWHAIVRGSNGKLYDPSKWAGMPHDVIGQCMPCVVPLRLGKPSVLIGQSHVRVDVPGILSRRGCEIGTSHQCECNASDEDRVRALIQTLESAILTAQRARTGDSRALRQLAVIYRVLRGVDPAEACADARMTQEEVGIDSGQVRAFIQTAREVLATAADELFSGDTWTLRDGHAVRARKVAIAGHHVGFAPCLAALGPLAGAAATAGTIAAVADPIAAALREMAGKDSDFGRAMQSLREVLGPLKLASSFATGILALAEGGIPDAIQAGTARWAELLRAPGSAAAVNDAHKVEEVARTLSWTEKALSQAMPAALATHLTPGLLDLLKDAKYEDAVHFLKSGMIQALVQQGGVLTPQLLSTFESMAIDALRALAENPLPPPAGQKGSRIIPDYTPPAATSDVFAPALSVDDALREEAEELRANLRTVPTQRTVPAGWSPIFAMGCRQMGICR